MILLLSRRILNVRLIAVVAWGGLLFAMSSAGWADPFDGERALADTRAQCELGPRVPGTEAHVKGREWIKAQIEAAGWKAWDQPFTAELALTGATAPAWNLWGLPPTMNPAAPAGSGERDLFVLSAHWDTRPYADDDFSRGKDAAVRFQGANDGAAGVAVVLEIARAIAGSPLAERVVLVFFDAEDSGVRNADATWCIGSQYAADHPMPWFDRIKLGINLDMIAHRGMKLSRENHSMRAHPFAVDRLYKIGLRRQPYVFTRGTIGPMIDDHLPFIRSGVPYIDLIGLPYDYWHRLGDTPDECDPEVMAAVGSVLIEFMATELKLAVP